MGQRIALSAVAVLMGVGGMVQMPPEVRTAVDSYRVSLEAASAASGGRLEAALDRLDGVRDALMRVHERGSTLLERLSEAEFQHLREELPGAIVNRDEILLVKPDPDYFADLAARHGDDADRSFFDAYKKTYPGGVWPVYLRSQTDYSGCTAFGAGGLVAAYRTWSDYRRTYSSRYGARADAEIDRVSAELTQSTCACGDASAVEKEMRQFMNAFPRAPIAGRVRERLRAVRAGRSDIRLRCRSG